MPQLTQEQRDAVVSAMDNLGAEFQKRGGRDDMLIADAIFAAANPFRARCPECYSRNTEWMSGEAAGIDTSYRVCNDCGHDWDQQ